MIAETESTLEENLEGSEPAPAGYGPEIGSLIRLAIPVSLASAGMSLMTTVSSALVGRIGSVHLAAYGLSNLVFTILSVLAVGMVMGLDPMISQAVGAKNPGHARHLLWQGGWLSLMLGGVVALLMFGGPFLQESLGVGPEVAQMVRQCVWVRIPCIPFMLAMYAQRSYLMSMGTTSPLVVSIIASNVLNLVLSPALILGGSQMPPWLHLAALPALGAVGASLVNGVCIMLMVGILGLAIRRRHALEGVDHSVSRAALWTASKVGFPIGLQMLAEIGVFTIIGFLAGKLGTTSLAANQIALTYSSLVFTAALGLGSAGSVRVGMAVGASDAMKARQAGLSALGLGAVAAALMALLFLLAPGLLARAMTNQPEVIEATVPLLRIIGVFLVFDALQGIGAGVLRGLGETRFPFLVGLVCHYLIGIPVALFFGVVMKGGIAVLWWGLCASLAVIAGTLALRFVRTVSRQVVSLEQAS